MMIFSIKCRYKFEGAKLSIFLILIKHLHPKSESLHGVIPDDLVILVGKVEQFALEPDGVRDNLISKRHFVAPLFFNFARIVGFDGVLMPDGDAVVRIARHAVDGDVLPQSISLAR